MKNYLHLAERAGAVVHPLTTVTRIAPPVRAAAGEVETVRSGAWSRRRTVRRWTCDQVVLAAGTYGTQRLLHAMKDDGTLPLLSPRLGHQTRTNSEAVLAATGDGRHRRLQPRRGDHVVVPPRRAHPRRAGRYGKGSNAIGLLQTVLVDGGGRLPRWLKALGVHRAATRPRSCAASRCARWSERTVIALVMQSRDNSIVVSGAARAGSAAGR